MKNVKPSGPSCATATMFEQENQVIHQAKQILCARLQRREHSFTAPQAVKDYLCLQLAEQSREIFCCLFCDAQHRLIDYQELFMGTIDGCSVYPREVVKAALRVNAAVVIVAHNHPSQVAEPSQADIRITSRLKSALALVDIRVLDHIVVGGTTPVSMAERGLL